MKSTPRTKCIETAKEIAKIRDGYVCQKHNSKDCGQMHGSHIIPVSAGGMIVADPENIICLCASAHKLAGDSWHEAPKEQGWFDVKFPGLYDKLKSKHIIRPIKKFEWEEKLKELKQQLKELVN